MTIFPAATPDHSGVLEKTLGVMSIATLLATVPQVFNVWSSRNASGVSLISWVAYFVAACLWMIHGVRRRDRSIYLPCIGWILLDAAIVIGILVRQS